MPHGAAGVLSPLFQRVGLTLRPPVTEEASLADGGFRSEQVWDGFPRLPSRWLVTTKGLAEGRAPLSLGTCFQLGHIQGHVQAQRMASGPRGRGRGGSPVLLGVLCWLWGPSAHLCSFSAGHTCGRSKDRSLRCHSLALALSLLRLTLFGALIVCRPAVWPGHLSVGPLTLNPGDR